MAETLRVDVPVGFLLPEAREITVSVDRPSDAPLAIRLRLIPAETDADRPEPVYVPVGPGRMPRPRLARDTDGYPDYDYGGGD